MSRLTERADGQRRCRHAGRDRQDQAVAVLRRSTARPSGSSTRRPATSQPYDEADKNTPGERQVGRGRSRRDGLHDVYRERPEGWWEGDLGQIYRPKYFVGGVAVHGSNSVPNYPASHGCVRVSVPAMDFIWDTGT